MDFFTKQCLPVQLYAILVVIGIVGTTFSNIPTDQKFTSIGMSLLWSIIWGYIMVKLCKQGHEGWVWFILFLPIILWTLFLVLIALKLARWPMLPINKKD